MLIFQCSGGNHDGNQTMLVPHGIPYILLALVTHSFTSSCTSSEQDPAAAGGPFELYPIIQNTMCPFNATITLCGIIIDGELYDGLNCEFVQVLI